MRREFRRRARAARVDRPRGRADDGGRVRERRRTVGGARRARGGAVDGGAGGRDGERAGRGVDASTRGVAGRVRTSDRAERR